MTGLACSGHPNVGAIGYRGNIIKLTQLLQAEMRGHKDKELS
jgi:hypothetical protein